MKKKGGHTGVKKGKRVMLFFQNGRKVVTKFIEKKGNIIITEDGKFRKDEVYKLSIYKSLKNNT